MYIEIDSFRDYLRFGMPVDLIVNKRTKVSKPLEKPIKNSNGKIYRH